MKDLILIAHPNFEEVYAHARKTNNLSSLQNFLRTLNTNSFPNMMEGLTTDFEALATPPSDLEKHSSNRDMNKATRKRIASTTTPVIKPKKTTGGNKREHAVSSKSEFPEDHMFQSVVDATDPELKATDGDSEQVAKQRKNERERRRRQAVSNGFDELFELLKLPQAAQIDKVSILHRAIDRIKELERQIAELQRRVVELQGLEPWLDDSHQQDFQN